MKSQKQQKEVTVLNVYKFRNIARVCFETLSSDNSTHYHTCFDGSVEKSSCTCDGHTTWHKECYHITQLKARAAEYFQSRQPVQPEKANPVAEAQAFIARVQAEQAAKYGLSIEQVQEVVARARPIAPLHNAAESHFEERGGRTVPMR